MGLGDITQQITSQELPMGWEWRSIGDIAFVTKLAGFEYTKHFNYIESGPVHVVRALNVGFGEFKTSEFRYIEQYVSDALPRSQLLGGELLITYVGVLGSVVILPEDGSKYHLGPNVAKVVVNQDISLTEYVLYFLLSPIGQRLIHAASKAVTQPSLSMKSIRQIPIPIPPIVEQRRIANFIKSTLTKTRPIKHDISRIPNLTERLRKAILSKAFLGLLTERIPEDDSATDLYYRMVERKNKRKVQVASNDESNLLSLPTGWIWVRIDDVSEHIVDCLHSTPKFQESGKYCIDTTCIEDGRILFDKARYVKKETYLDRIRRLNPEYGDVLFAREGTVGTAVMVPKDVELCLGQRIMMFRVYPEILPAYFMWALNSPVLRNQMMRKIMGTTVSRINISDVKKLVIPLAPSKEQSQIVSAVQVFLDRIEEIEEGAQKSVGQVGLLTQSILNKAFKGEIMVGG